MNRTTFRDLMDVAEFLLYGLILCVWAVIVLMWSLGWIGNPWA